MKIKDDCDIERSCDIRLTRFESFILLFFKGDTRE